MRKICCYDKDHLIITLYSMWVADRYVREISKENTVTNDVNRCMEISVSRSLKCVCYKGLGWKQKLNTPRLVLWVITIRKVFVKASICQVISFTAAIKALDFTSGKWKITVYWWVTPHSVSTLMSGKGLCKFLLNRMRKRWRQFQLLITGIWVSLGYLGIIPWVSWYPLVHNQTIHQPFS